MEIYLKVGMCIKHISNSTNNFSILNNIKNNGSDCINYIKIILYNVVLFASKAQYFARRKLFKVILFGA